jgi:hypothetical protein
VTGTTLQTVPLDLAAVHRRAATMAREWQHQPPPAPSPPGRSPRRATVAHVRQGIVIGLRTLGFKGSRRG